MQVRGPLMIEHRFEEFDRRIVRKKYGVLLRKLEERGPGAS